MRLPLADALSPDGTLREAAARPLLERVRGCQRIVVATGAGVSAESGIPTFRDAQTGIWATFRPEELATPEAFQADPARVLAWYDWRRSLVSAASPNPGHLALARLQARLPQTTLITQNVDGLHQAAGSPAVLEFHGNLWRNRCTASPAHLAPSPALTRAPGAAEREAPADPGAGGPAGAGEPLPRCLECGALLRPDVVWFGEAIPPAVLEASAEAAARCDVFVSAGTSAQVYPAASLAAIARDQGASIIEVNLGPTPLSDTADYVLLGESGKLLPALTDLLVRAAGA